MQVVLGIDKSGKNTALHLVKRLRFTNSSIDLAHVISPSTWSPTGVYGAMAIEASLPYEDYLEMEKQEEENAKALLRGESAYFMAEEGSTSISVLHGNPTEQLLEHADAIAADLIAVNAPHEGPLLAFLTGSVARGMVIGARQSVLLGRCCTGEEADGRPVRAVLATDYSPYMEECIALLLRLHPRGIQHLTILSAYPELDMQDLEPYLSHLKVSPIDAMRHELETRNHALIQRLKEGFAPFDITIRSVVSGDPVNLAIAKTMEETESELLIVGAQGHSFLERLTLGSVSFRQAMTAPYSVLVLRVP